MSLTVPAVPVRSPRLIARLSAEALGTMFLVLAGIGAAMFTVSQVSTVPSSLAAGLAIAASMLAFGHITIGHFNPAITLGSMIAGRTRPLEALAFVVAQLVGGLAGALVIFGVVRTIPSLQDSRAAFDTVAAGFGEHSTAQVPLAGVLLLEVIGVALLVGVFLAATSRRNVNRAMAPFAVGLSFAVLVQLGMAIGNVPFNPARATANAIFSSSWALEQLWLFWVAPLAGATIAGLVVRGFSDLGQPDAGIVPVEAPESVAGTADARPSADLPDDGGAPFAAPDGIAAGHRSDQAPGGAPGEISLGQSAAKGEDDGGDEAREFFDGKRG
ncbi:MIP/aquaporin family protein [Arthrobacter sp. M4]|uniref:MIP/aquaporin family protein n=1 Tax=Arthrobacter sp. M4 TaxID=218160 RepID=UPI001CDD3C9B|nr:aquaporin [Arthrobacter sp. M4]MCA4132139.1 aquaporin [Arthrobacter sp. M4]